MLKCIKSHVAICLKTPDTLCLVFSNKLLLKAKVRHKAHYVFAVLMALLCHLVWLSYQEFHTSLCYTKFCTGTLICD